jgi:hypothetical protein
MHSPALGGDAGGELGVDLRSHAAQLRQRR